MRGSWSPVSISSGRVVPRPVRSRTAGPLAGRSSTAPTTAAREPAGTDRAAASTASASAGGDDRDGDPFVGHVQRVEPEHLAGGPHRGGASGRHPRRSRCRPADSASSFSTLATPPRVGSRSMRTEPAASIAATRPVSGAVSEARSVSKSSPPAGHHRDAVVADRPAHDHASPGRARSGPRSTPAGTSPMPLVVTRQPSAAPRSTTLVSPVTRARPRLARVGHRGDDAAEHRQRQALLEDERRPTGTSGSAPTSPGRSPCRAPPACRCRRRGRTAGCTTKRRW